jgi:serine phosphatase RsbU (regulator of sigma subunit)
MFGNSVPAGSVGGDLFEYINFQQRYDIDARIQQARRLSKEFLEPLPPGAGPRNSVDDNVQWLKTMPGYRPEMEAQYRLARSSEEVRVAEQLRNLYSTAGVLLVDAQGHGIISAKIASTVRDTFHALMLTELDRYGKTTPMLLENINLRLSQSLTARNALLCAASTAARWAAQGFSRSAKAGLGIRRQPQCAVRFLRVRRKQPRPPCADASSRGSRSSGR